MIAWTIFILSIIFFFSALMIGVIYEGRDSDISSVCAVVCVICIVCFLSVCIYWIVMWAYNNTSTIPEEQEKIESRYDSTVEYAKPEIEIGTSSPPIEVPTHDGLIGLISEKDDGYRVESKHMRDVILYPFTFKGVQYFMICIEKENDDGTKYHDIMGAVKR